MSYLNQPQDASMEDILSSIRKILDDDPKATKKTPEKKKEEPLELTDVVEEETKIDAASASKQAPEKPSFQDESLMSPSALSASINALSSLKEAINPAPKQSPMHSQTTLEEMAKSLLMPLLKDWINQNLPPIVEKIVKEEVQKLTQRVA